MTEDQTDLYKQLVTAGVNEAVPSAELRDRVLAESIEALPAQAVKRAAGYPRRIRLWPTGLIAAAVGLIVLGGIHFWPTSPATPGGNGVWWSGPTSAWAAEIQAAIAKVEAVTCRERSVTVCADGQRHTSSTWRVFYVGQDSYRRDIYDNDQLREIQWYTPDGDGMHQASVRFDLSSHHLERHKGSFGVENPVERVAFLVRVIDEPDRWLGTQTIDGRECVGFEVRASRYGSNPDTWLHRVWFDVETRLPARTEMERPVEDSETRVARITVRDRFDYSPNLSADTFEPNIPAGFVFGHPDEIRKRRANQKSRPVRPDSSPGR